MDDDTMLPEDDRDRSLARRIGARLEARGPLDDAGEEPADAALLRALTALKQEEEVPPAGVSERVWARLEKQTQDRPANPPRRAARILPLRPAWTWMAAASVLVLAGLGWLLLFSAPAAPERVATAGDAIATYTAPDGSVVTLRPHSQLDRLASDAGAMRYRLEGEGFFDIVKDETRTFSVEAGDALVQVLGTRFDLSTWGTRTTVYLEEGRVRLTHAPTQQSVVLAPGQRSTLTADGVLLPPEDEAADEYTDWMQREMTFTQRPLRLILAELEHHYHVRFDVPARLLDETLSGRILLVEKEKSIEDLGVVMGGRFIQVDDTTYRFVAA